MTDIVHVQEPRITSLERLAELASQKKAVRFYGLIKPAAVVLHMQGAFINKLIKDASLFEYVKPVQEKKPVTFYRSGKPKPPRYEELRQENMMLKEAIKQFLYSGKNFEDAVNDLAKAFRQFKQEA